MRVNFLFLTILFIQSVVGQHKPSFRSIKFDKVVMYDFEGGKGYGIFDIVDEEGKLASTVSKQVVLDYKTIQLLRDKLESKKSFGADTAACYDPHLGFVYYLHDKVVGQITICLDCNRLSSNMRISGLHIAKPNEVTDVTDGMTIPFRSFLIGLLKQYHFSHIPKC